MGIATKPIVNDLIHELSHLDGTEDVQDNDVCNEGEDSRCYTANECQRHITDNPPAFYCQGWSPDCKALENASSYEFFAVDAYLNTVVFRSVLYCC